MAAEGDPSAADFLCRDGGLQSAQMGIDWGGYKASSHCGCIESRRKIAA